MRGFCGCCSVASNENRRFDLLVGLANDQNIMGDHSQGEQALMKIQREWAEARVKGDSSYSAASRRTIALSFGQTGRIVNKRQDLQTMVGDIVLPNSKSMIFGYGHMATLESSSAKASSKRTKESKISSAEIRLDRHICETGRSMEGSRFTNHSGLGKLIAHG
jgi:hypothetical protein